MFLVYDLIPVWQWPVKASDLCFRNSATLLSSPFSSFSTISSRLSPLHLVSKFSLAQIPYMPPGSNSCVQRQIPSFILIVYQEQRFISHFFFPKGRIFLFIKLPLPRGFIICLVFFWIPFFNLSRFFPYDITPHLFRCDKAPL